MRLPLKVEVCPIVDAVVEIRFSSDVPAGAMLGLIYRQLTEFTNAEQLPILQLPEPFRSQPDLQYQPHHRLSNDRFMVQIGPKLISVVAKPPYAGWPSFSPVISKVFKVAMDEGIIQSVERLGLRYINGFEKDVFDLMNIKLQLAGNEVPCRGARLKNTLIDNDGFESLIQVYNDMQLTMIDGTIHTSGIDIDVSKVFPSGALVSSFDSDIEAAHSIEKNHFFRLVEGPLLTSLKPIYA